eukprot:scaffold40890_cov146-Skeletonema_marinoi.AAC.1
MHLDDFKEWLGSHPFERDISESAKDDKSAVYPVKEDIESCFEFLLDTYNINSSDVGVAGFCWGVWAMTKACEMKLFRCAVGFHPSIKIESMVFGGDQEAITKKAADNAPILLCVAGNDLDNLKPSQGGALANIIAKSKTKDTGDNDKAAPRCVEFPEMMHGWVSRGDTSIEKVKEDAEAALNLSVDFLRHRDKYHNLDHNHCKSLQKGNHPSLYPFIAPKAIQLQAPAQNKAPDRQGQDKE